MQVVSSEDKPISVNVANKYKVLNDSGTGLRLSTMMTDEITNLFLVIKLTI